MLNSIKVGAVRMKEPFIKAFITPSKGCTPYTERVLAMTKKAFSLSETLIAMGLIGVLAVTMITLNNFSDNKQKVAEIRMAQVENALQAWGKAVTSTSVETGFGASANIKSASDLKNSLENYFDADRITIDDDNITMTLDDINIKFQYAPSTDLPAGVSAPDTSTPTVASIDVFPSEKKFGDSVNFSASYALSEYKFENLDSRYDGIKVQQQLLAVKLFTVLKNVCKLAKLLILKIILPKNTMKIV